MIHYLGKKTYKPCTQKLSSANYIINRAKNVMPQNIRLLVYNSLFKSHLQYGILAWGRVPVKKLQKIISIQKKCIRNVANKDFRSHTEPIFCKMKLMKFHDILFYESLIYMHNYVYARLPNSLLNMFTPLKTNGRNGNYLLKKYKGIFLDRFPSAYLPKTWNNISNEIKNTHQFSLARNKIKKYIFANYEDTQNKCKYELCPDCYKKYKVIMKN